MILFSLLSLFLATPAFGQDIVYDQGHNVTSIVGTWASGSQNVVTGSVSHADTSHHHVVNTHIPQGFAQPANESFVYPLTTGISFSL